jgi:ribose transport system ATP-binding protein
MTDIDKSFFGVPVLRKVSLTVERGSIHALIGENGAGKSTLMNVLAGVYPRDGGSIRIDGKEIDAMSIPRAKELGIAFVHQEISLFNDLTAAENIFLGQEITRGGLLDKRNMDREADRLFASLGVDLKSGDLVRDLTTAQKQLLSICRSLFTNADLFILDEPTTALSNAEIENFFRIVRKLKEEGKTFLFISHKMPEIFELCDHYTVLRNGRLISSGRIEDTNGEELARAIVGESFSQASFYTPRPLGAPVLAVDHLSGKGFEDVTFSARRGEIVGLTGLQGSGAGEMMETIFGLRTAASGTVQAEGEDITNHSTQSIMRHHVGMVPSNRKENSVFPTLDLLNNFALADFSVENAPGFQKKRDLASYERYKKEMNLKANSPKDSILSLSGGNQQKVIVARWLKTDCDILLLDNPTQGIDVGAKDEIYRLLLSLAQKGKTVVFLTMETSEIRKCADRCLVFYHGAIVADLGRDEMDDATVMLYATGARKARREGGSER